MSPEPQVGLVERGTFPNTGLRHRPSATLDTPFALWEFLQFMGIRDSRHTRHQPVWGETEEPEIDAKNGPIDAHALYGESRNGAIDTFTFDVDSMVSRWSKVTPRLFFCCFCLLVGDLLFGYDTASFGGLLANPGFLREFGTTSAPEKYVFRPLTQSLLSSLAFIGKFLGCLLAGPLIEYFGHRIVFALLSITSYIGIIIELTSSSGAVDSGRVAQFIVGRVLVYVSVGLVEVAVTTYQSEIVPAPLRGGVIVSLQLGLNCGALFAQGMNRAFSTSMTSTGWRVVCGLQFLFPTLLCLFAPFVVDSPRWLLSKDREEEAIAAMRKLRPAEDHDQCEEEVAEIKTALQSHIHKAPWTKVFMGTNFRRTVLVLMAYSFQQITGQAFTSTYQTTFYKTNGYADQAFTYPVINTTISIFIMFPAMYFVDLLGRRVMLLLSCGLQALWLFLLAGIGSRTNKTSTERASVVAFFVLFNASYNSGLASIPYALGAEIPNSSVREKTDALGTGLNVVWAFVTNFIISYMLDALSFKVGYVFGGISVLAAFCFFAFLPETKNLALEEIDAVFSVPFNPFRPTSVHTRGAAARVTDLENDGVVQTPSTTEGTKA